MNKDCVFPKEFELIVTMINEDERIETVTRSHETLREAMNTIHHLRPPKGNEVLKYEINVQRMLV